MDFGLVLPTMHAGASAEGIEAAAEVAERRRLVGRLDDRPRPRRARRGGRVRSDLRGDPDARPRRSATIRRLRLGTSVIVVPQRQAVVLAKELATLDVLSRGRVIAGVGIGWNRVEFANLGMADRFAVRGAYLDETVRLWRHLWGGATGAVPRPLPPHRRLRVRAAAAPRAPGCRSGSGGRAPAALRAGRSPRRCLPLELDDRRPPTRSGSRRSAPPPRPPVGRCSRCRPGSASSPVPRRRVRTDYALRGSPDEIRAGIADWAAIGVDPPRRCTSSRSPPRRSSATWSGSRGRSQPTEAVPFGATNSLAATTHGPGIELSLIEQT